jgi:hypothetical protein
MARTDADIPSIQTSVFPILRLLDCQLRPLRARIAASGGVCPPLKPRCSNHRRSRMPAAMRAASRAGMPDDTHITLRNPVTPPLASCARKIPTHSTRNFYPCACCFFDKATLGGPLRIASRRAFTAFSGRLGKSQVQLPFKEQARQSPRNLQSSTLPALQVARPAFEATTVRRGRLSRLSLLPCLAGPFLTGAG